MHKNIFISSRAFKEVSLQRILALCREYGINNLELSANIEHSQDVLALLIEGARCGMRFLLHNYFPRPQDDFVINLASDDENIISKSIVHCKKAIDISAELGSLFYSVHAGCALHASEKDLGCDQSGLPRIPLETAYHNFLSAVKQLAQYASEKKVKLAVENNVITKKNLIPGKRQMIFLTKADEMLKFHRDVGSDNLFFLIDIGHLNVNSISMGFDKEYFLNQVSPFTAGFHLSSNDGSYDQHLPYKSAQSLTGFIKDNREKVFIIEVQQVGRDELMESYNQLEELLTG